MYSWVTSFFNSSTTTETKQNNKDQTEYEKRLAEYKERTKGLSSLYKHILYVLDEKNCSTSHSVATKLKAMHSSAADFKGFAINLFNEKHRGSSCPFFKTTALNPSLHLGTTRIWKADGSVDQKRWNEFVAAVDEKKEGIVTSSKLHAYLAQCTEKDPEEKDTGRQASSIPGSKSIQVEAAILAWNEVFDRLACGWKLKPGSTELEPYISMDVIKEFFEDSPAAYLRAECGLLPIPKPNLEKTLITVCKPC